MVMKKWITAILIRTNSIVFAVFFLILTGSAGAEIKIVADEFRDLGCLEFMKLLDMQRPELAQVKDAIDRGDSATACASYIVYFRNKEIASPLLTDWAGIKRNPGYNTMKAERLLAGHLWDGYSVYEVPETGFDWYGSPMSGATRFPILGVMRSAIHHTQDPKYIRFVVDHVLGYIDAYPIEKFNGKTTNSGWTSYMKVTKPWYWNMIGHRLHQLTETVALIRKYPQITDEELLLIIERIYQETGYLCKEIKPWVDRRHNGGLMMIKAMAQSCEILSDFTAAREWLIYDTELTAQYLDQAFYPDGMCVELSTAYCSGVSAAVQKLSYAFRNEAAIQATREKISDLVTCLFGLSDPIGWMPSFGDLYAKKLESYIYQPILDWLDLPWGKDVTYGSGGPKPPFTVWPAPGKEQWCGYYTMRSDWSREARYLAIDCGPWGTNHQHGDRLSFVITANGAKFIIDPTSTLYASNKPDAFIGRQSAGFLHNTITVDGVDEYQSKGTIKETHEPLQNVWEHGDNYTLFVGSYSFAPVKSIKWERRVLFVDGSYWLLQDVLTGDQDAVKVEQNFQFESDIAIAFNDNQIAAKAPNGARLVLLPLEGALKPKLTIGDKTPHRTYWPNGKSIDVIQHGRGWAGRSTHKLLPAPAVTYAGEVKLPATITVALVPFTPGQQLSDIPKITNMPYGEKTTWKMQIAEGTLRFVTTTSGCSVVR